MVPVSIEGVRRNFGISSVFMYTVTLLDEAEQRIFPVGVERHEAPPFPEEDLEQRKKDYLAFLL